MPGITRSLLGHSFNPPSRACPPSTSQTSHRVRSRHAPGRAGRYATPRDPDAADHPRAGPRDRRRHGSSAAPPGVGAVFQPVQPAVPAPDQDDHRAADLRHAGRRDRRAGHVKAVGRMGLRAIIYFEVVTTLALLIGLFAVNVIRPGVGLVLPRRRARRRSPPRPQTWDQILLHIVPDVGHPGDGRRRRAADRRLSASSSPSRWRWSARRRGRCRVLRGARRDDVQVHEHRHEATRRSASARRWPTPSGTAGFGVLCNLAWLVGDALHRAGGVLPAGAPAGDAAVRGAGRGSSSRR